MSGTPRTLEEARRASGEYLAGGTDLLPRLARGLSSGPAVDLRGLPGFGGIDWHDSGVRVGAGATIAQLAFDPQIATAYPGLARAAAAVATPEVRARATVGGNLLQRSRCWYFRHPVLRCLKRGGDTCPARDGEHRYHVCFDIGPCAAPHPSTLAVALVAYGASVEIADGAVRPIAALYGDGSDGRRDHQLGEHELLTAIRLPPPLAHERAAYVRAISRTAAEWPLVEAVVRLGMAGRTIDVARVAVGGVAPIPLRRGAVEAALAGRPPTAETFEQAARAADEGASPLPMTRYKLALLRGTVLEALERAAGGDAAPEARSGVVEHGRP